MFLTDKYIMLGGFLLWWPEILSSYPEVKKSEQTVNCRNFCLPSKLYLIKLLSYGQNISTTILSRCKKI